MFTAETATKSGRYFQEFIILYASVSVQETIPALVMTDIFSTVSGQAFQYSNTVFKHRFYPSQILQPGR